jgi:TPR repeat protein
MQRGDYKARRSIEWRHGRDPGDADAQFNLAQAYKLGRGVPADLKQAEAWYQQGRASRAMCRKSEANYGLDPVPERQAARTSSALERGVGQSRRAPRTICPGHRCCSTAT